MPLNDEESASADLGALLEGLLTAGVDFILVGGLAAVIQGAPLTTIDVDIVHDQSPLNIAKLLAFLKSVNAHFRRPDDNVIKPRAEDLSGKGHALFSTRSGPLDVLAIIEEGKTYKDLLEHAVEIEFRGFALRVLRLKTMIELKRNSTDPKEKQRLPLLQETLRQLEE
jgi:hypothetical protein